MKNILVSLLKLATAFGLMWGIGYLAHQQFPWWITAVVAAGVAFFIPIKTVQGFAAGLGVFGLLWGMQAYHLNMMNQELLATKMGELFGGYKPIHLVYATALIGSLLGSFGAMTGSLFRQIFFPMDKKEQQESIPRNEVLA